MIGLVIVAHGGLGEELRHALEHVVEEQEQLETVSVLPSDDVEQKRADVIAAVRRVERGDGVVIFTDVFGGTPSNLAVSTMTENSVEVIAGVNLPMLIRLANVRCRCSIKDAVDRTLEAGHKYITVASKTASHH